MAAAPWATAHSRILHSRLALLSGGDAAQWEKGQDKSMPGRPLGEMAARIKKRYDYREEDIL